MGKFLCSLWKNGGNLHVEAAKMHFLAGHGGGGVGSPGEYCSGGKLGENWVKWGKMGEFLHILSRNGGDLHVNAFVVAVGAGIIPGSVWPHELLLVQFSLCLLLFDF